MLDFRLSDQRVELQRRPFRGLRRFRSQIAQQRGPREPLLLFESAIGLNNSNGAQRRERYAPMKFHLAYTSLTNSAELFRSLVLRVGRLERAF